MPGSVLSAPAPWPKAGPTQQPWSQDQTDASVSVIPPARIQLDAQVQLDIDAENQSMAAAGEETQAFLRDEEDALAAVGVAYEGLQQIRDERRARETDRVERMIDPSYGTETSGVILLAGRDAEVPQGDDQSSLALVRPNEVFALRLTMYFLGCQQGCLAFDDEGFEPNDSGRNGIT
jgi:hypothetical protein